MIFIPFSKLKQELVNTEDDVYGVSMTELRIRLSDKIGQSKSIEIDGFHVSTQNLYFLMDLYEKEEYRVFSDWIITDEALFSYLRSKDLPKNFKVKSYEGHTLKESYNKFLTQFLNPKIEKELSDSIDKKDFKSLLKISKLKTLLPLKNKIEIDNQLTSCLRSIIEDEKHGAGKAKEQMLQPEFVQLINGLDDSFYQIKILFLEAIKGLIEKKDEFAALGLRSLKKLELNNAHKREVDLFISKWKSPKINKSTKASHLFRTPLFYVGLLVCAVLIYILIPKEVKQPNQNSDLPMNRTGLDSLTLDEIKNTDSLLGYKSDTLIKDNEEFNNVPVVERYQMIDSEDTLKNDLARSLAISMVADYEVQMAQNNSQDCNPLRMGEKTKFQMDGVMSLSYIIGGFDHKIENNSSYDLYILLFKNETSEAVYGSFVPVNGDLICQFVKGMRMIIYSGRDLTRFNPLQKKNGGYGSIVDAKRIDKRLTAHFCELNQFNLQLMSKSWVAMKNGRVTVISDDNGPIHVKSDAFEE
jgi:hypothetical protein